MYDNCVKTHRAIVQLSSKIRETSSNTVLSEQILFWCQVSYCVLVHCLPHDHYNSDNLSTLQRTRDVETSEEKYTRSLAIAEGPRDASCQLKSCQLPRNSAETTYTTSPDQIDGMKLDI